MNNIVLSQLPFQPQPTNSNTTCRYTVLSIQFETITHSHTLIPSTKTLFTITTEAHKGQPLPLCRKANFHCTLLLHTSNAHFQCTLPLQCSSILHNQLVKYCACVVDVSCGTWRTSWLFVVPTSSIRLLVAANPQIEVSVGLFLTAANPRIDSVCRAFHCW